jgi:hypothetical protein
MASVAAFAALTASYAPIARPVRLDALSAPVVPALGVARGGNLVARERSLDLLELEPIDMRNVSRIGVRDGVVTPVRKPPLPGRQPELPDAEEPAETSRNSFWAKLRDRTRGVTLADAKPADVLKRYGVTYVVCSVALSLCSFSLFYALVASGVIDVTALLGSVGVTLRGRSERAGAVGLAYAMHKMASPIRFPPTVALTAVVARRRARLQTPPVASARSA